MAANAGPNIIEDGLITFYDFQNLSCYTSGTTVNDLSGNRNTGTFSGATTVTNGYSVFAGATNITTTTSFSNPQTFSVSVWFNTTSTSGTKLVGFENVQTGTTSSSYDRQFVVDSTGNLYWGIYTGALVLFYYGIVNNGTWYNAVVTFNSGTQAFYLNGAQVGTSSAAAAQNYIGWWRIGGYQGINWNAQTFSGYFTGNVGPFLLHNRVLTSTEVGQNFNAHRGRYGL
jgi:hypothetical protein